MKKTPLCSWHKQTGARMVEFAGYEMPIDYSGVIDEHLNVRAHAGIFDVSHMGEFWVKGEGALDLLQYITTNNVSALEVGQAHYSCFPNGEGGIVDDLIVYRYSDKKYMLVVNASNEDKDWKWINKHNRFGATLENASASMALIALQGPKAGEILSESFGSDFSKLKPFRFAVVNFEDVGEVIVSATGYTGAGGFELYCYNEGALSLWEKLIATGSPLGLKPAGLAARDTLRLEMGYALYGNDIDDTTSPIEAGLGWIVKLKSKENCIDRVLLAKQKELGTSRKLVGIKMLERGIPRKDYTIMSEALEEIGRVTSGTMSPSLDVGIGMAYILSEFAAIGTSVLLQVRNKQLRAEVVKLPFLNQ